MSLNAGIVDGQGGKVHELLDEINGLTRRHSDDAAIANLALMKNFTAQPSLAVLAAIGISDASAFNQARAIYLQHTQNPLAIFEYVSDCVNFMDGTIVTRQSRLAFARLIKTS